MHPELLPSSETKQTIPETPPLPLTSGLTESWIEQSYDERTSILETIKNKISLKIYYRIAEKIKTERQKAENLLYAKTELTKQQSRYSFVLDSGYFEQLFLN